LERLKVSQCAFSFWRKDQYIPSREAVVAVKAGQETPKGYYNLGEVIKDILSKGGIVKACGTCIKARGIKAEELVEGVQVGRMLELANWIKESEKVLTF